MSARSRVLAWSSIGVWSLIGALASPMVSAAERRDAEKVARPGAFTPRPSPIAVVPRLTAAVPDASAEQRPDGDLVTTPIPILPEPLADITFGGAPPATPEPSPSRPTNQVIGREPGVVPAVTPAMTRVAGTGVEPTAAPIPSGTVAPAPPRRKPTPSPARSPSPPSARIDREAGGIPVGDFREFEKGCDLPEDAPDGFALVPPGTRLRARVASFMRVAPHCRARILDVLEEGAMVTVLGGGENGWYRVRGQGWPAAWVGARLLARLPQR